MRKWQPRRMSSKSPEENPEVRREKQGKPLKERCMIDQGHFPGRLGVEGSNPFAPTNKIKQLAWVFRRYVSQVLFWEASGKLLHVAVGGAGTVSPAPLALIEAFRRIFPGQTFSHPSPPNRHDMHSLGIDLDRKGMALGRQDLCSKHAYFEGSEGQATTAPLGF
jgi:hypothetical protein